jgi:type IV pilus assembly protein PilE
MVKIKAHRGITLLELMITVAVIAIITAIAIPSYQGYISTARKAEGNNNLAALAIAQEEYFLENNTYFFGDTTTDVENASAGLWEATGTDGVENFAYAVSGTATSYTATATGTGDKVPITVVLSISK